MTVRVVDRGARAVLRAVSRNKKREIVVGMVGSKSEQPKKGSRSITVAQVAEWAEFGIGQPQRSWLRGWVDANKDEINERVDHEMGQVLRGRRTEEQALKRLGVWLQGQCQLNLANHPDNGLAPNAPSTVRQKGSSTPLINTGQLRSAISHKIE